MINQKQREIEKQECREIRLTDGCAYVSDAVFAQDRRWKERWREFLASRASKKYGKCPLGKAGIAG